MDLLPLTEGYVLTLDGHSVDGGSQLIGGWRSSSEASVSEVIVGLLRLNLGESSASARRHSRTRTSSTIAVPLTYICAKNIVFKGRRERALTSTVVSFLSSPSATNVRKVGFIVLAIVLLGENIADARRLAGTGGLEAWVVSGSAKLVLISSVRPGTG